MAQCLLEAGHTLAVFNRTPARAEPLARRGARVESSPARACEGAEAVVSMVADDAASRAVWTGADGILSSRMAPGAFAIECSTLSHRWVTELAAAATAKHFRYIDAPVTGLAGTALTLLVGAEIADLDAARALLAAFSNRIIRFGPAGAGTVYKLIVNMLGAVQIASAAETMALGERAGLDLSTVADAIAAGQAASPQVVRNTRRMAEGRHDKDILFTPQLRLKDVRYALELAQQLQLGSPFGSLAAAIFEQLCRLGYGEVNESSVMEVARSSPPAG